MTLTEHTEGPIVRAHGVFPTASAADEALVDYLTRWHGVGARGRVSPVHTGQFVVIASRQVQQ